MGQPQRVRMYRHSHFVGACATVLIASSADQLMYTCARAVAVRTVGCHAGLALAASGLGVGPGARL